MRPHLGVRAVGIVFPYEGQKSLQRTFLAGLALLPSPQAGEGRHTAQVIEVAGTSQDEPGHDLAGTATTFCPSYVFPRHSLSRWRKSGCTWRVRCLMRFSRRSAR